MSVNIHASTLTNIKEHYEQHVVQVFKAVFSNDLEHSLLLHGMNKHALLRLCSDAFYWKGVWLVPTAPVPLTPPDLLPHALYDRLHMLRQYLRPNDAQIGGVTVASAVLGARPRGLSAWDVSLPADRRVLPSHSNEERDSAHD